MTMEIDGEEVVTPSIYADAKPYEIPAELVFQVLEVLRLAHIYALKDSHPEELAPDFKPHKWDGYEIEFAQRASHAYRAMITAMQGVEEGEPETIFDEVGPLPDELIAKLAEEGITFSDWQPTIPIVVAQRETFKVGRFVLFEPDDDAEVYITSWDTWADCEAAFPIEGRVVLRDDETGRIWRAGYVYEREAAST